MAVELVARLQKLCDGLWAAIHRERAPLELSAFTVRGAPIPFEEARHGEYVPFHVGDHWGPRWGTTWFRVRGWVPPSWAGRRAVALFDLGYHDSTGFTCEALAWKDGRPWRGVTPNHRWLPVDGAEIDFYLEAAANPKASVSGPNKAPSMIAMRESAEPAFKLRQAELAIQDEDLRRVALDFKAMLELALTLPADSSRRSEILSALDRFSQRLEPWSFAESAVAAGDELRDVMAVPAAPDTHRVSAVGHAHIDTAWLWPLREARRKCSRTFSTSLALMNEYIDYHFACSQAAQYAWMKESYPDIYERIREKVQGGQWEPVGSMWVEADCNLPSGESLVRQLLHGKRFFMQELDYEPVDVWLPDVFGYPASLPQLIAEAGCQFFMTQKLSWNEYNKPLHHTFWWEGLDGTRIFTHFPPADTYNGSFAVDEVVEGVRRFKDQEHSNRSLYLYGWGDGGGGPEPDMIEVARRLANLEGAPRVAMERARDFFEKAYAEARGLDTWVGELYFELHRGTYTSQSRTKRLNRRGEQALREAEMWSVAAGGYPAPELDSAWKQLLINQFHDILPGSSIDWVYEEAERDLAEVIATAEELTERAQVVLLSAPHHPNPPAPSGRGGFAAGADLPTGREAGIAVFNVNSHARREVVEHGGNLVLVSAPPCGWAVQQPTTKAGGVTVVGRRMENELLRVEWDEHGLLTSVWDKEVGREVLDEGKRGNLLQLHPDNPKRWDAWDLDITYRDAATDVVALSEETVEHKGPLRGAVRFARKFGSSRLTQRMVLDSGSRVLRFETEVDWQEEHQLLKVAFPVAVRWPRATYEIQFGHVERPTHSNTSWDMAQFEVCAHRWADLGEPGYGVALLNDCKYGHDIHGSVMHLSLLRAPTHPDPTADRGRQTFTYALMPHAGDFRSAGVVQAAEDLNAPLRVVAASLPAGTERSLVEVESPQVIVETIKKAEDSDAVVIRLYEAWGGRCRARLRTTLPVRRAWLCDLLERERAEVPVKNGELELDVLPFKVLTVKLEP